MTVLLRCSSEATFTDQTLKSEKQSFFKSITSIIGQQGGRRGAFCLSCSSRSKVRLTYRVTPDTLFFVLHWNIALQYIMQENNCLIVVILVLCVHFIVSQKKERHHRRCASKAQWYVENGRSEEKSSFDELVKGG